MAIRKPAKKERHLLTPDQEKELLEKEPKVELFLPKSKSTTVEAVNFYVNGVQFLLYVGKTNIVPMTVAKEYQKVSEMRDLY